MEFHRKQSNFINDIVSETKNSPSAKKPVFISVDSSPGSGKTTILLQSSVEISEFLSKNIEYETTNIPKKQVLILAFDKKMKNEIEKKILNHPDINEDIFEVSTVHSLFFRELKKFQQTQDSIKGFELDYTKSFFSKKMITYFLDSLSKSSPSLSNKIDLQVDDYRVLSESIATDKNVDLIWALINTYYSSPYNMKMIDNISKDAQFFSKSEVSIEDLEIDAETDKTLTHINESVKGNLSNKELLFRLIVKRINQLSVTKEKLVRITKKQIQTPIDVLDVDGNIIDTRFNIVEKDEREIEVLGNLVKVPHCFYYKSFYTRIIKDESFARSVFGNYKTIMVDEAQDNDRILFQILLDVAKKGIVKNFAFVGDPDQSIYAFKSPDHFDMLSHMASNSERFKEVGIDYRSHALDITFRFGADIASFVNSMFGSKVEALTDSSNFVYPDEVKDDKLANLVKNISAQKGKTAAIICRSNAEAMKMFVKLKTEGCENVVLHSSTKDDLKDFAKKGIDAIDNERTRNGLKNILSDCYGDKEHFTHTDILSQANAISYLANNGYSKLVRFSKDEIDNYIIPPNRKRKDIVWIGTSHLFKGDEMDYAIIAGDFFKPKENIDAEMIASSFVKEDNNPSPLEASFIHSFFNEENTQEVQEVQDEVVMDFRPETPSDALALQLSEPSNNEEKCIYYVALTRAKEGVFFAETPYWNEINQHINNSFDVKKEFGHLLTDKTLKTEEVHFDFAAGLSAEIDMSEGSLFAP